MRLLILLFVVISIRANAQNKFANKAFLDADLEIKVTILVNATKTLFANEIDSLRETTQYYKTYTGKTSFYNTKTTLKDRKYEISCSFQLSSKALTEGDAKSIYEKFKKAFIATGVFQLKPETVEGTRVWFYASEANASAINSKHSLVLEYYAGTMPSVGFLITRKK